MTTLLDSAATCLPRPSGPLNTPPVELNRRLPRPIFLLTLAEGAAIPAQQSQYVYVLYA